MPRTLSTFAINVRAFRKEKRMTQAQLAEDAGMSDQAVRDIESGRRNGSLPTLTALAKALEKTSEDLLTNYSVPESERNKVSLTPAMAQDIGIDYRLLQKIASLGPGEMNALATAVDALYELSVLKSRASS